MIDWQSIKWGDWTIHHPWSAPSILPCTVISSWNGTGVISVHCPCGAFYSTPGGRWHDLGSNCDIFVTLGKLPLRWWWRHDDCDDIMTIVMTSLVLWDDVAQFGVAAVRNTRSYLKWSMWLTCDIWGLGEGEGYGIKTWSDINHMFPVIWHLYKSLNTNSHATVYGYENTKKFL